MAMMRIGVRRGLLPAASLLCMIAFGCSSSSSGPTKSSDAGSQAPAIGVDGASDAANDAAGGGGAEPSVYITSTLGPTIGDAGGAACPVTTPGSPFLSIGTVDRPVPNAGVAGVNTVAVSCTVHSEGGSRYAVDLSVYDGNVAEITISGTIGDTPGVSQGGISATFSESSGASSTSYEESECTLTLNAEEDTSIASGRIWATVTCPTITNEATHATCAASATFVFENCAE